MFAIIILGATIYGRRLSNNRNTVNSVYIETPNGEFSIGGLTMLTITELIAVLSFAVTCFALGYSVGRNSKVKK